MKKYISIAILLSVSLASFSQTTEAEGGLKTASTDTISGWKKGGTFGLSFSQVSLNNWAAGGVNSFALNGISNLFANYKKDKLTWDNNLAMGYGIIRQGDKNANWVKSDDKIDFTSKMGYRLNEETLYFAALYNFKTQFAEGFDVDATTVISSFMAPAYSLFAIGIDYKKGDYFSAFLAPVTLKTTIVNDVNLANAGAFGVEGATYDEFGSILTAGKKVRNEFGGYLRLQFKKDLIENVNLDTRLDLFSNYLNNPGNIDVSWETLISMKVNKYISATLSTHLIYDDDIDIAVDTNDDGINDASGPRVQFKEVFGAGLSFQF